MRGGKGRDRRCTQIGKGGFLAGFGGKRFKKSEKVKLSGRKRLGGKEGSRLVNSKDLRGGGRGLELSRRGRGKAIITIPRYRDLIMQSQRITFRCVAEGVEIGDEFSFLRGGRTGSWHQVEG